jgi:hypothetical protein
MPTLRWLVHKVVFFNPTAWHKLSIFRCTWKKIWNGISTIVIPFYSSNTNRLSAIESYCNLSCFSLCFLQFVAFHRPFIRRSWHSDYATVSPTRRFGSTLLNSIRSRNLFDRTWPASRRSKNLFARSPAFSR